MRERFSSTTMMRSSPCAKSASSCRPIGQPQAKVIAFNLVNAEFVEGLTHVEIGFPGGDDADLRRPSTRRDDLVELVGAHEGQHGVALEVVQARFLAEESICQPDVQAARRHREIGWRDDLYAP